MELKSYQKQVIADLSDYFTYLQQYKQPAKAFNRFWEERAGLYNPLSGEGMRPYQDNVEGAVHLSVKVPTAGGKTFIACNALQTIFNAMPDDRPKAVVWLVPWSNLLDQTVKNLSDPGHPYCQKLNALFGNRVAVYEKKALLQGAGFNPSVVQEQLSIMVLNFASVRARNKDDRKIFEQNGALAVFAQANASRAHVLDHTDETALINVIRSLNPVLVVDESHNAESELSVEMLRNLNPSFILDLTATPKDNANIISLVPAIELKKEHMVKLPVIVYNQQDKEGVIDSALHLQRRLELLAMEEEKQGGRYIRPIVLFQAQSKTKEENTTFDKLKEQLVGAGIPPEQVKIKTANRDELKGIDLMSRDCEVRYVITVNALKEGWDCPFAYILASLADRSSEVDVTQILGRVLRQPYVIRHSAALLNLSYVITASARFNDTLQEIVKGLRSAGFSEKDYRGQDAMPEALKAEVPETEILQLEMQAPSERTIDMARITFASRVPAAVPEAVAEIEEMAFKESAALEQQMAKAIDDSPIQFLSEVGIQVKHYRMRQAVAAQAKSIMLPKFVQQMPGISIFDVGQDSFGPLDRSVLLSGFRLSDKATDIRFEGLSSDLYKIDVEEIGTGNYKMSTFKIEDSGVHDSIIEYILSKPRASQLRDITHQVIQQIGKLYPIPDADIKAYVRRILEHMNAEQLRDFLQRRHTYTDKIRQRITQLADAHAENTFKEWKEIGKIRTQPAWKFPEAIIPARTAGDIGNSLYTHEGEMNGLELQFINEVASCDNILFWHRNLGRGKGFSLNGYKSDHYPDFIIVTKKGRILLVETKGGDRDNSDSAAKLKLGKAWAEISGEPYRYLMVFDKNPIDGAYELEKAKELIRQM